MTTESSECATDGDVTHVRERLRVDTSETLGNIQTKNGRRVSSSLLDIQKLAYSHDKPLSWISNLECLYLQDLTIGTSNPQKEIRPVKARVGDGETPNKVRDIVLDRVIRYAAYVRCKYFWIDQECIDQRDGQEKEVAVQSMDLVYSHSDHPVALLSSKLESYEELAILASLLKGKFIEDYRGADRMQLLIRTCRILEGRKRENIDLFGELPGELEISSAMFRQELTHFCLAYKDSLDELTCQKILQRAAKYTVLRAVCTEYRQKVVDIMWCYIAGVGAIPTLVATIFRMTIPESGRYILDVADEASRAVKETEDHFGEAIQYITVDDDTELDSIPDFTDFNEENGEHDGPVGIMAAAATTATTTSTTTPAPAPDAAPHDQFTMKDLKQYFIIEENWRYLAATIMTWFILDFAFYGLGINSPRTLAKLWRSQPVNFPSNANTPTWIRDGVEPNDGIYKILRDNAWHSMVTVSIGGILGSTVLIKVINYVPRKKALVWSFWIMALLLAVTRASFIGTFQKQSYIMTIFLYRLCQFFFNMGPNSLTFIIPAKIFPTRYRCTCHGISAAAGKLGSIVVQVALPFVPQLSQPNSNSLGFLLIIFSGVIACGSIPAWAWLPELQGKRSGKNLEMPGKGLEELAKGRKGAEEGTNRQMISLRRNFIRLWNRIM